MSLYRVTAEVEAKVKAYHPTQAVFFVFGSYRKDAIAVGAYVPVPEATSHARRIGGCKRLGRLVNGQADCM